MAVAAEHETADSAVSLGHERQLRSALEQVAQHVRPVRAERGPVIARDRGEIRPLQAAHHTGRGRAARLDRGRASLKRIDRAEAQRLVDDPACRRGVETRRDAFVPQRLYALPQQLACKAATAMIAGHQHHADPADLPEAMRQCRRDQAAVVRHAETLAVIEHQAPVGLGLVPSRFDRKRVGRRNVAG